MGDTSGEFFFLYSFIRASRWASQSRTLRWLFAFLWAFDLVIVFNISIPLLKERIIARLSKDRNTSRLRNGYKAKQREFRAKCGRCHVDVSRCGVDVGSMSGRCGVRVRPMSGRCAVDVRPIWGRCHVGVCEERKACAVIVVTEEQQQNCGHSSLYQSFTSTKEIKSSQEDEVHTDP